MYINKKVNSVAVTVEQTSKSKISSLLYSVGIKGKRAIIGTEILMLAMFSPIALNAADTKAKPTTTNTEESLNKTDSKGFFHLFTNGGKGMAVILLYSLAMYSLVSYKLLGYKAVYDKDVNCFPKNVKRNSDNVDQAIEYCQESEKVIAKIYEKALEAYKKGKTETEIVNIMTMEYRKNQDKLEKYLKIIESSPTVLQGIGIAFTIAGIIIGTSGKGSDLDMSTIFEPYVNILASIISSMPLVKLSNHLNERMDSIDKQAEIMMRTILDEKLYNYQNKPK